MSKALVVKRYNRRCLYMEMVNSEGIHHYVVKEDTTLYMNKRQITPDHLVFYDTPYERNMELLGRPCIAEVSKEDRRMKL